MKNIALTYDLILHRKNGRTKTVCKNIPARSFLKQFLDMLSRNFSNYSQPVTIKDTSGVEYTVTNDNQIANDGIIVGTGIDTLVTPGNFYHSYMTALNVPSPYVASASSTHSIDYPAWRPFSTSGGYSTGLWMADSLTGWLKLDTGGSYTALTYTVQIEVTTRAPKSWTLEGSNDDSTWDTLDTVTGETWTTTYQIKTYTCDTATTAYRYFRLNVTVGSADRLSITGLVIYHAGTTPAVSITDYTLAEGRRNLALSYSSMTFGAPVTDATSTYFVCTRLFTNASGSTVTIGEIGIQITSLVVSNYRYFLVVRDTITPIAIAHGESLTVNYTIRNTI